MLTEASIFFFYISLLDFFVCLHHFGSTKMSEKRKRPVLIATRLANISLCDLKQGIAQGNFLPLYHTDNQPILVEAHCDGLIPQAFGIQTTEFGTTLKSNVENVEEQAQFNRLDAELGQLAMKNEISWRAIAGFTDRALPWNPKINSMTFTAIPKEGKKAFPPTWAVETNPNDIQQGVLQIQTTEEEPILSLANVLGSRNRIACFEIKGLIIKRNKKDPNVVNVSWSKRLRFLEVDTNSTAYEFVSPEEQAAHNKDCKRKHIVPIHARDFQFGVTALLHELVIPEKPSAAAVNKPDNKRSKTSNEPTTTSASTSVEEKTYKPPIAKITGIDGDSPCYVALDGGGRFPMKFAVSTSEEHKTKRIRYIPSDEAEVLRLEEAHEHLGDTVLKNRFRWFPNSSGKKNEVVKDYAKPLINPKKRKISADLSDEEKSAELEKPIQEGDETWPRDMSTIIDNHLKIVESDGSPWSRDLELLSGRQWETLIFHLKNVYTQQGSAPKADWSSRLVYIKMKSDGSDYQVGRAT